ncbi:MAG: hypothetical protein J6P03_08205 [Opitutales bacterium]|nr:hypothetical protein [Opitutales bacterium]
MPNKSKCPYCNATITRLNVEEIELERNPGGPWKGVSYACPVCRKILSVGPHPDAAKSGLLSQIQSLLESQSPKK